MSHNLQNVAKLSKSVFAVRGGAARGRADDAPPGRFREPGFPARAGVARRGPFRVRRGREALRRGLALLGLAQRLHPLRLLVRPRGPGLPMFFLTFF